MQKKNKSAAGLDGVDFETIKNLPLKHKLLLVYLMKFIKQTAIPLPGKNHSFYLLTNQIIEV